ncbi:Hypothetical protein D9617_36g063370 [Elsinoe fawcettii]|nr:Hypothetical protein D9617_36g063370 [Elsinoe fawcettii]
MSQFSRDELAALKVMQPLGQALFTLTVFTLLLRLATRTIILRRFGYDDLAIVLASIAACAGLICTWLAIKPLGALYHGNKSGLAEAKAFALGSAMLYIWSMTLLKISLGFFFYRIFAGHLKHRIAIITAVAIPVILGVTYFVIGISTCAAVSYLFNLKDCPIFPVYRNLGRVWGAQNVVTDLVFPILSVNAIRKSEMKKLTKVLACALVCFAAFGSVASVIRLAVLAPSTKLSSFTKTVYSAVWTQLETGIGIMCANIACLRPLGRFALDYYQQRWGPQVTWHPRVDQSRTQESVSKKTAASTGTISMATILWRLNSVFSDSVLIEQPYDWREDRISQGQELQVPPQAVLQDRFSMMFPPNESMVDKGPEVHTRSVDEP